MSGDDETKKANRTYALTEEKKEKIRKEAEERGRTPNPMGNRTGAYWGAVEALIELGPNDWHSIKDVRDMMHEIMSQIEKTKTIDGVKQKITAWDAFHAKGSRDGAANPLDLLGKIEQNFRVLQRLPKPGKKESNPYGLKLAQFGMAIDIKYEEVEGGYTKPFFKLNTTWDADETGESIEPQKPGRRKKKKKSQKKEQEPEAQSDSKGEEQSDSTDGEEPDSTEAQDTEQQPSEPVAVAEAQEPVHDSAEQEPEPEPSEETESSEAEHVAEAQEPIEEPSVQGNLDDENIIPIYLDRHGEYDGSDDNDGRRPEEAVVTIERVQEIANAVREEGYSPRLYDPDENQLPFDLISDEFDEQTTSQYDEDEA